MSVAEVVPAEIVDLRLFKCQLKHFRESFKSCLYLERKIRPMCGLVACKAWSAFTQVLVNGVSRSLPFFCLLQPNALAAQ
jgi:hypothetical protein